MSYLLPQFKCLPDTLSFHSRTLLHPHSTQPSSKHREPTNIQVQCMLSVTSLSPPASITTTTLIDLEKLRLLSSDAHSNSSVADRPWTYVDTAAQPIELNYGSRLTKENLLTSEEAIIAAASAEAVALAKAAARFAKNAAMSHSGGTDLDDTFTIMPSDARGRQVGSREPIAAATVSGETFSQHCHVKGTDDTKETDDTQTMGNELNLLQEQISNSPVMRSKRQKERKTRRVRGTEKDAANIVSVKSGSSTRKKKRPSVQDVDYSDPLRYHRGTASSKLLTATEEQELSRGIQELIKFEKLQDELTHRCGAEPTFAQCAAAAGVDKKTLRKRISYGTICRDRMVKSNIRLVISIAKNYQGAGMNLQDLVQEGCRGLLRGTEKFDASKGFKFSTYAHWWIKQAVRKSLSDQSRTIRLPIHMVEATYRVKEAKKQLYSENGKHPNNEEVAKAAGLSMKKLQAVLLTPKAPRSLDQKIGFNMDLRPSDVISDPEAETSEELLIKQFMRQDLDKVLNTLSPRENQVIRWRFGLEDSRMRTLQEIGELLGVSRERIRQIETSAFRKLKNKRRTKNLQQYLISQA